MAVSRYTIVTARLHSDPSAVVAFGSWANSGSTADGYLTYINSPGSRIEHSHHQHVLFYRWATAYADRYGEPTEPSVPIEVSLPYWEALSERMKGLAGENDAETSSSASEFGNPVDNVIHRDDTYVG